ncbi:hypothetical protein FSP39_002917 [Pinctada imbricata]|uniref:Uncharacterized protein n=1 Tax=Pinctada imbricata TaxID=66713 RepID=A0AA88Y257_PINIB|nr:hypothetical protein FSP39_002917 [Pinctada imbricata]
MSDDSGDDKPRKIKVTAVGDSGVGKTCMLMTYVNNQYPKEGRVPSLYENNTVKAGRSESFEVPINIEVDSVSYVLGLTDTIGEDEYRRLRELFTAGTEVFLVCFSVTEPETLENVKKNWLTEIKILSPKGKFILVGTKIDRRDDQDILKQLKEQNKKVITTLDGVKIANSVGAKAYVECSAIEQIGLKQVFETVVMVATGNAEGPKKPNGSKPQCSVS